MFIEFPSNTTQGNKVTVSLLNICSVYPSNEGPDITVIQMTNGAFHYVNTNYEQVMNQIRSLCK